MRFVLYTQFYSPHEIPLAVAACQCFDEVWYVVDHVLGSDRSRVGWEVDRRLNTIVLETLPACDRAARLCGLIDASTLIMYGIRGNPYENLIQASPAIVVYACERWLKPWHFVPGIAHVISPSFVRSVLRMRQWLRTNPRSFYFGLGVHAIEDMAFLLGYGRVRCDDRVPCGCVQGRAGVIRQMRLWGYFVSPSQIPPEGRQTGVSAGGPLRVLFVGRLLGLKRVDTLIAAVAIASKKIPVKLTIVGEGPELGRLERLSEKLGVETSFWEYQPMDEIRRIMRMHDILVQPSNAHEGWGACVNEALEENMIVLASRQTGSGVTILPDACLFEAGDERTLAAKIQTVRLRPGIGAWTPGRAAKALKSFAEGVCKNALLSRL